MKAIAVTEFGGPEKLHEVELPDPAVGPGEIRVRVAAAAVNPTDGGIRTGKHAKVAQPDGPVVPGMDFAGAVDAIGDGTVTDLSVGDLVMGLMAPRGSSGAYSELVTVPAESVVRAPEGCDAVAAATLPMNLMTARMALDLLDLSPGQTLAVTGAAGILGGYAIQLAKEAGLRVIADAAERDIDLIRGLGAAEVVARGDECAAAIRAIVPDGVDAVIDCALLYESIFPAIRDGGQLAVVRGFDGDAPRGIEVRIVSVGRYLREHEKLRQLRDLVEAGRITVRVADTYPAAEAPEAHRRFEAGGTRGRLVLTF